MAAVTRARLQTAYQAGYQAEDGPPPDYIANDAELLDAWDKGFADRQNGRRSTGPDAPHRPNPRPRRTPSPSSRRTTTTTAPDDGQVDDDLPPASTRSGSDRHPVHDAGQALRRISLQPSTNNIGGFVLGMVVYLAAIQYIRSGPGAPLRWFRAKFENKVTGGITAAEADSLASLQQLQAGPATASSGGANITVPGGVSVPVTPSQPGGVTPGVPDPLGIILGGNAAPKPTGGSNLAGLLGSGVG